MACKQQPGREARHGGVEVVARARRAAAGGLRAVRAGLAGAVTSDQQSVTRGSSAMALRNRHLVKISKRGGWHAELTLKVTFVNVGLLK